MKFLYGLWDWFAKLVTGRPHFYVGGKENPYLIRWYIFPRNPLFNLYLHKFMRDDDDRALHDHPWWFISFMIKGGYLEQVDDGGIIRTSPSIAFREAKHKHRVILDRDENNNPIPCWTIVLTGRTTRVWGFHCPKGFVPWQEFVDQTDHGNIGRGCGD